MESHTTVLHCPIATFSLTLSAKCCNALGDSAERWGPRSTASQISAFVHCRPVLVGHPICTHLLRSSPAGCNVAIPDGHMSPRHCSGRGVGADNLVVPVCFDHNSFICCCSCSTCLVHLFCRRNFSISFPDTNEPVACKIGGLSPSNSLRCLESVVTALSGIGGTVMSVELPQDCGVCIDCTAGRAGDFAAGQAGMFRSCKRCWHSLL
jgi:hypothetical protein